MKRTLAITGLVILLAAQSDLSRAQWVQTNGPSGGTFTCITSMGSILFVGTATYGLPGGGGVYRSKDTAKSWQEVNSGLASINIWALGVNNTTLFAATDSGVFTSSDSGSSWKLANTGLGYYSPSAFINFGSEIFAESDNGGVFLSKNLGLSWSNLDSIPPSYLQAETITTCGTTLFALNGIGFYRSTDSGASWVDVTADLPNDGLDPIIAMGTTLFGAGAGALGLQAVYRSTDYGSSWTLTSLTNAEVSYFAVIGTTLFAFGSDLDTCYGSNDSGKTWSKHEDGFGHLQGLEVFGGYLIANNVLKGKRPEGCGIYLSSNSGNTWSYASKYISNGFVTALTSDGSTVFAAVPSFGVALSTDGGSTWSDSSTGLGDNEIASLEPFNNYLFAGGSNDSIYVSTDRGKSFSTASNGIPGRAVANISPVFSSFGYDIFAGDYYGIYRSSNSGRIWSVVGSGLPTDPDISGMVVFANSLFATSYNASGVIRSTDLGETWKPFNNGLPNLYVLSLAVSGSNLYVSTINRGLFRSTDSGSSWIAVNQGLPDDNIGNIASSGRNLFILTDSGVYLSTDDGEIWTPVNLGLAKDSTLVSSLAIGGEYVFVGTEYAGVWRRPLADLIPASTVAKPTPFPPQIQFYPNPFSSQATITFTNQNEGYTEVTIVNLLGAEVARLFTGELPAGEHSFVWDMPPGLPNGMYECVVNVGGQTQRISLVHLQ